MRSFALFFWLLVAVSDANSESRDAQIEAVNLISETADRICAENLLQGSRNEGVAIEGKAHGEVVGLAGKLVKLGIEGAGSFGKTETEGVLQKDLANAIRSQAGCKQGVFYSLLDRFLPESSKMNPFVEDSEVLQIPEPLSSIRSGYRFAMKRDDSRKISGTNFLITLVGLSGNSPPWVTVRFTDLASGKGDYLKPKLGESKSFGNCLLTYYAANKKEKTASFLLSCS